MPMKLYTEEEYLELQQLFVTAQAELNTLERMRPQWAQGYSSDSVAAQACSTALQAIWDLLEVTNQTDCIRKLKSMPLGMY